MINLYNKDCMEALKEFKDNQFDLAIVDPPYGIDIADKLANGWASKSGGTQFKTKEWDKYTPKQEYFDELFRVSKNQIIWGGNYFISKIKKDSSCWIVWDKNNGSSLFADAELAWTSFEKPVRISKVHWCGSAAKWETGQNKIHPTQKPIKLYEWILMNYANKGNKILDTHLGSGSIAIACDNLGFDLDGYELDKEYFEAASKRLKQHQQQIKMF